MDACIHAHGINICAYMHSYMDFSTGEILIFGACLDFSSGEIQTGTTNTDFSHRRNPYMHTYIHIFGVSKYVHVCKQIFISPMKKPKFLTPVWISPLGKSKLVLNILISPMEKSVFWVTAWISPMEKSKLVPQIEIHICVHICKYFNGLSKCVHVYKHKWFSLI